MKELLTKNTDSNALLEEQEFYELRLFDALDQVQPCFLVRQAHAQWSTVEQQFVWDDYDWELCSTFESAQKCYGARREALVEVGFISSDLPDDLTRAKRAPLRAALTARGRRRW
jgi:hypothetical protein